MKHMGIKRKLCGNTLEGKIVIALEDVDRSLIDLRASRTWRIIDKRYSAAMLMFTILNH
jgi:hypothetical protein